MRRILIIEDDRNVRRLLRDELERHGYRVTPAATGQDGLELLDTFAPDLVVLDIRMPDRDGLELLAEILDRHPEMLVVIHTAYACYQDNFLSWGANAYVLKSSDLTELLNTIEALLPLPRPAELALA